MVESVLNILFSESTEFIHMKYHLTFDCPNLNLWYIFLLIRNMKWFNLNLLNIALQKQKDVVDLRYHEISSFLGYLKENIRSVHSVF